MKVSSSALVVLATSGTALGSWVDWIPFQRDPTVTATLTRTVQVCPCNGEVRVTQPHPANGKPTGTVDIYTVTGAIDPYWVPPQKTVTKAGPIVVVFSTAGTMTTKTGVKIELKPTSGPIITKTVWTGPQPTDGMAWIDWEDDSDPVGTLTRSHTKTETVYGPAPTGVQDEPWADWVATTNTKKSTTRSTTRRTTSSRSSSSLAGPIGASTTSSHTKSSSSSSTSSTLGPIGATTTTSTTVTTSTTSSSLLTTTTSSSSSSFSINPIDQTSSSSSSSAAAASSSTSSALAATSSSSSSSADAATSSSLSSTTTTAPVITTTTTTSSAAAVTTTTTTSAVPGTGQVVVDDVRGLDYITAILQQHNVHRRNHSAVDLTWSAGLASTAAKIASTCVYAHDIATDGGGYGQNIGAGYTPNQVGVMITNDMYNGEFDFYPGPWGTDNPDLTNFSRFGHLTQIVWKSTQQVGCATQFCPNGLVNAGFTQYFTVCNYYPPGNFRGQYSNVGAPLGGPIHVVLANPN